MELASCPVCKRALKIREYHCEHCKISFSGDFENSWLAAFDSSQLEFIKLFLLVQGNLKELQQRLGLSYPTVKNRLGEIVSIIAKKKPEPDNVNDVLADLEEGFINVEEALNMIKQRREK